MNMDMDREIASPLFAQTIGIKVVALGGSVRKGARIQPSNIHAKMLRKV